MCRFRREASEAGLVILLLSVPLFIEHFCLSHDSLQVVQLLIGVPGHRIQVTLVDRLDASSGICADVFATAEAALAVFDSAAHRAHMHHENAATVMIIMCPVVWVPAAVEWKSDLRRTEKLF